MNSILQGICLIGFSYDLCLNRSNYSDTALYTNTVVFQIHSYFKHVLSFVGDKMSLNLNLKTTNLFLRSCTGRKSKEITHLSVLGEF